MQNKIGFVGVGQCGSNIAQLFEHLNYTCVCINSSEKDFKPLNTKYNYCTPKTDGCNHDRKKAITILQKYYKNILKEIIDKLYDKELIYFIFSTGGGTGSGFSPVLIELLNQELQEKFPSQDKTICAIPVLPSTEEKSPQVQFNSYECYKSLSQIENLGTVFTLDNSKMNKFTLNKTFVSLFHTTLSIPDHTHTSGNIDTAELFKLLKQRGNAIITSFPTSQNLVPDCNLLSSIIVEGRKFGIDFYFTTHYLKQFKTLLDAIKSAGTSYMLLAGTEKENFALLKEELMPYDIEDGLELESFTSLNLINCKNKYVRFISKLPPPIK